MDFDELPRMWQACEDRVPLPETVLAEVAERSRRLERDVRRRDLGETLVALALLPVFGACIFVGSHPVARLGALILSVFCVVIPLRLRAARRGFAPVCPDRSLQAFLERERERVLAQARLLRSVFWWYLLPLGVGVVLFFAGGVRSLWASLAYAAVVIAFYGWLYRLNQQAVASELEPRLRELDGLLGTLAGVGAESQEPARG